MNIRKQKGAALIISLIMLLSMTILVMSSSRTSILELRMARNYQYAMEAFQHAESGIAVTTTELNIMLDLPTDGFDGVINGQYRASMDGPTMFYNTILVDDSEVDADPTVDSNDMVRLISQGTSFDHASRTIEVRVAIDKGTDAFALDKAILTNGDITFGGDSALHGSNQDVHSNSNIYRADKIETDGVISASGDVYGTADGESNVAEIEIPLIDPSIYAEYADYTFYSDGSVYNADGSLVGNDSYNGWVFNGSKWRTQGSNVEGGLLYFEGDAGNVDISSNIGTPVNPWEISILADGWIDVNGTPVIANYKNPSNPEAVQAILFMAGTDIKLNGNANTTISGVVAAGEQFYLSGTINLEGTIIAADQSNTDNYVTENTVSGTADITNDGSLSIPAIPGSDTLEILSWREILMSQAEFENL